MNIKSKLHIAQQEVYYGQLMDPKNPLYNIGGYTIFKGSFNTSQFKHVIEGLSKVFDVFNIRFDFTENEPSFCLKDFQEKVTIDELDFSSEIEPRVAAKEWMQAQFNIPFDLNQEKLYIYTLIKIAEDEFWWFVCFHHLITDGFGFAVKVNYVIGEYENLIRGGEKSEVVYPSYLDATKKSFDYLLSEQYHKDVIYWNEKYSSIPNSLLNDKRQKKELGGNRISILISKEDRELFNRLSLDTKANISQFTIAALLLYLGKTTDKETFSLGIPVHNRSGRNERKTLGMFAGILPYKGKYVGEQILSDVISEIQQTQRNDYKHRLYPISYLNRSLKLLSESRWQLFDIVVNYEPLPFPKSLSPSLHIEIKHLASTLVEYPLSIRWSDYGEDSPLELNVDYQRGYFEKNEVEMLIKRLLYIIRQFEFGLNKPIEDISIIPIEEEKQLLHLFNDTAVAYPKDKTVVDLFEEQVKKTPDAIAVVYEGETLSYRELNEKSNQLGHYLIEQGVEPDTLVGICLERSLEMLIGILGILKSGGAYVPVDPDYPSDRIGYMLVDGGIKLVLSREDNHKILADYKDIDVLLLDKDWEKISVNPTTALNVALSPSHLAYVIYTSGSTGRPKGVMNEHGGILNRLLWGQSHYKLNSEDTILQKTSFSFDVSVWELLWSVTCGAKLVFAKPEGHKDAIYLKRIIEEYSITTIHFVPSMLSIFLGTINQGDCSSLKLVICSGEALQLDQIDMFKEKFNRVRLDNLYGPTEAAIEVSSWEVPLEGFLAGVLIGQPVANTSLYIVDDSHQLLPIGVIGELCIGGIQVARGYLNKEELTREKFIENPFKEGDRIYKTGDLARWLPDGTIEYIGRKDNQVKIRGYRIELGEIENVLSSVRGISQCCVLAKEDSNDTKRLVGYVVVEGKLDRAALQEQLKLSLPEYMVPMIWVELAELPLTSNGKLDRKALPNPDSSDLSTKEYVAPRTETEQQLAQIWENLLGVEKVGVHDNFFELGGHSLLATRLVSIIRKKLSIEISIREVFEYTTISALAVHVSIQSEGVLLPTIAVQEKEDRIPLSFSQERLWFLDQLQGSLEYHMPIALRLEGVLDASILEQTLQSIVSRHEVLRTILLSEDGIGYQEVISEKEWILD
ncbi:non-ribosomal peptide synthetase, partial [Flavobacterium collinsii]|uniref:non-ribosomal peptide synthetase n=2 Tax=Flavobacterium collinsii TaxID=1114861 RepID=UPI00249385B4